MVDQEGLFIIPGYHTSQIQGKDITELQALLEKCVDYCLLVDGHPPSSSAASSMMTDCPPGRSVDDKVVVGIYNREMKMIGVLDVLKDYPMQSAWWIGLMLLDPEFRNHGLGSKIVRAFEDWARLQGAKTILLGVIEENEKACKFWHQAGYELIVRQPPRVFGTLTHIVMTMAHDLTKVKCD